ncbi:GGDEF domain-containing protein [Telmatospirillum siberiense]|uniref:diguanylate cyclase n=1 Tax=Telmatospirillum siberiense TaxID=382514 RepID=A0A2N3Q084_9PROT|nr:GGDEF domain-containing protein [Telmatospirillum siberiense]PKU26063.1 GGDEF domain-containing protein [Telmatospirillum siberiense]
MQNLVHEVMDQRLLELLDAWREAFYPSESIDDPKHRFARFLDHLLVIGIDGVKSRYLHYGHNFTERFGTDLTGKVIDLLPTEILPAERRGMLAFEYTYARRVQRPLWRSYTAEFGDGQTETWQRLVLPAGKGRLVVGAFATATPPPHGGPELLTDGVALLRFLIERVPVVIDSRGDILELALSLESFSDTQQQMAELEEWATLDALTGVANLRHFHHLAGLELDHAYRMGRSISVLILDIDHFKKINDSWGHAVGDEALKAFAGACRKALREPDILGRIGGEEFAVALPNTRIDEAQMIAERLRRQVEQVSLPLSQGGVVQFTVSIGVATSMRVRASRAERPDIRSLLAIADGALYRSKSEGRNRISVAQDSEAKSG